MIIVKFQGGLGNQMFQYANGYALSRSYNQPMHSDLDWYSILKSDTPRKFELGKFGINLPKAPALQLGYIKLLNSKAARVLPTNIKQYLRYFLGIHIITEKTNFPINLKPHECIYISGYWQKEKYFLDFKNELKKSFCFPELTTNASLNIYQKILKANESVSIHIRRGDYTLPKNKAVHGLLTKKYYDDAVKLISSKLDSPNFYFFSDDIDWVKIHFGNTKNACFVDETQNEFDDLYLMSLCQHHIIANSTFSWWGAWLNEKKSTIVIAPKKWLARKSDSSIDLIPKRWFTV